LFIRKSLAASVGGLTVKRFVIAAAGLGSRLGKEIPKCLLPIGEACLIDYQIAVLPTESDVRVVVGYQENEVVDHVRRRWPHVTFVRNPAYATTSNTYSLQLAAQHMRGPFIAIDGDLIIEQASFFRFLERCDQATSALVGVTSKLSQESVAVHVVQNQVVAFHRAGTDGHQDCKLEWCGIALIKGFEIGTNRRFLFEELSLHLPLPAVEITCVEIDTPQDHDTAIKAIREKTIELPPLPSTCSW